MPAIYQIDAFTTRRFAGNPAAVLVLEQFPNDSLMQAIAAENNLAETAFLVRDGDDYQLRWFTPVLEVPLCGHGTLASAAVVMERLEPSRQRVTFHTASGPLIVTRRDERYVMDFPVRRSARVATPMGFAEMLGANVLELHANEFNYMALLESANSVRALEPDFAAMSRLDLGGVIVTARGDERYDMGSRYFSPAKGIAEDPVTGGAHCMLAPYWSEKLAKTELHAYQASARGGDMICRLRGERVELEGSCVFYLEGHIAL